MKVKERNSSIELLRCIAMFLIVLSHCCVHGLKNIQSIKIYNNILLNIFTLGNLGVALFVIITGYVSIEKNFKIKKIILLELQIIFYAVSLFLITAIIKNDNILSFNFFKSFFPIIFKKYWFMTAYINLYIFTPFINKLIHSINRKECIKLVLTCILLGFLVPTITTSNMYFNELFQFITFYLIGGYIRKYVNANNNIIKINCYVIILILLLISSSVVIETLALRIPTISKYGTYFFNRDSILILLLATFIFIIFLRKEKFLSKRINLISSTTLGVYLLHDNQDFREILWHKILKLDNFVNKPYLFLVLLGTAVSIFAFCVIIELIRKKIFDRLNNKMADVLSKKIRKIMKGFGEC